MNDEANDLARNLLEPHLLRENINSLIKTLEEHGVHNIPLDPRLVQAIPIVCAGLAQHKSPRIRATAVKLMHATMRLNMDRFELMAELAGLKKNGMTVNVNTETVTRVILDGDVPPE